jgi:hypothetical protein
MKKEELINQLKTEGYYDIRYIEGRGLCGLREFLFTFGLCYGLEENSYAGRYCYPKDSSSLFGSAFVCVVALQTWDGKGDPVGNWVKHTGSEGEWSNPNSK